MPSVIDHYKVKTEYFAMMNICVVLQGLIWWLAERTLEFSV